MKQKRSRILYAIAIAGVVAAGLASRSSLVVHLPVFVATYAGDTLWSLTVFLVLGFVFSRLGTLFVAVIAIAISFGVEFSQIYQASWINELRETRIGALLVGVGFQMSDLICYTAGVAMGVIGEIPLRLGGLPNTRLNKFSDHWNIGK